MRQASTCQHHQNHRTQALAVVELKQQEIRLNDVQNLILWILGEGSNPRWAFVKVCWTDAIWMGNVPIIVVLAHTFLHTHAHANHLDHLHTYHPMPISHSPSPLCARWCWWLRTVLTKPPCSSMHMHYHSGTHMPTTLSHAFPQHHIQHLVCVLFLVCVVCGCNISPPPPPHPTHQHPPLTQAQSSTTSSPSQ